METIIRPKTHTEPFSFERLTEQADLKSVVVQSVKNKVVWVNPNLRLPFNLKVGESSDLAFFAHSTTEPTEPSDTSLIVAVIQFLSRKPSFRHLQFWPDHHRSLLLGRVIFADNERRLYRDIDLKGTGAIYEYEDSSGIYIKPPGSEKTGNGDWVGLMHLEDARHDSEICEIFTSAGIRTHRSLAILELQEVVENKKIISIKEARKLGMVGSDDEIVVQIRGFGTKARINDVIECVIGNDPLAGYYFLQDAINLVSQELNRPLMSISDYREWFIRQLNINVAKMHRLGYVHTWLTPHNIPLDCRIVDLDDVHIKRDAGEVERDLTMASQTLSEFLGVLRGLEEIYEPKLYLNFIRKDFNNLDKEFNGLGFA